MIEEILPLLVVPLTTQEIAQRLSVPRWRIANALKHPRARGDVALHRHPDGKHRWQLPDELEPLPDLPPVEWRHPYRRP